MLKFAFKEWAVICKVLADGRQALILRKGGIAEESGEFQLEHKRFWLFPTFAHQQKDAIQDEAVSLLEKSFADRPVDGIVNLSHLAEVTGVYHVKDHTLAHMLAHLHIWSDETVEKRFFYRTPGLFVLPVRVYRAPEVISISNKQDYDGCRSWVELERALPTEGATPVLNDQEMNDLHQSLDLLLNPTAIV